MRAQKVNENLFTSKSDDDIRNSIHQAEEIDSVFYNYDRLFTIPANTTFKRTSDLNLDSVIKIGENVIFKNYGDLYLHNLKELPASTKIQNRGDIDLKTLTHLPENFVFESRPTAYSTVNITIWLSSLQYLPSTVSFSPNTTVVLKNKRKYF